MPGKVNPIQCEALTMVAVQVMANAAAAEKPTDLDRYIFNLLDHDETLFYWTVMSDLVGLLPIVYDPTIG
jgi:hypothetical protein